MSSYSNYLFSIFIAVILSLQLHALSDKTRYKVDQTVIWESDIDSIVDVSKKLSCIFPKSKFLIAITADGVIKDEKKILQRTLKLLVNVGDTKKSPLSQLIKEKIFSCGMNLSGSWALRIINTEYYLTNRFGDFSISTDNPEFTKFHEEHSYLELNNAKMTFLTKKESELKASLINHVDSIERSMPLFLLR